MSKSWPLVPFGNILCRVERFEPRNALIEYQFAGTYSFARGIFVGERKEGSTFALDKIQRIHVGDFVYCKIMAWEGAFGVVPPEAHNCVMSGAFVAYEINQTQIEPKYLEYYFKLERVWKSIGSQSTGTNVRRKSLHPDQFEKAEIPLPPLDEQRRIVAHIETLAARIAEARGLRQQAVEEIEILLRAARKESFTNFKHYQIVSLESVCAAIIDNLHSNPVYSDDGEFPCIRSPDVGWGALFLETAYRTDEAEYKRRTVRGEPIVDDIVVVREGGGTGKAAIVEAGQKFSLGQRVMMIRPNREVVLPKYFLHQMLSPLIYEDQILANMTGSASPHLNIGDLRKFNFVLPDLYEQHRTVAYLDNLQTRVNTLKRLQTETAAELDALLPAVLDRAFRGELV